MESLFEYSDVLEFAEQAQREQYLNNQDATGRSLGDYAKATESYNNRRTTKIQAGEPIKLKDTGEFYAKLEAIQEKDKIKITSKAEVTEKLEEVYGDALFGLTEESLKSFRAFILSEGFVQKILKDIIRYGS
jgi:cell division protein FtsX